MEVAMTRRLPLLAFLAVSVPASAQLTPEIAHVYPPGGKAGTTVSVQLGGTEWTPDMQFFVHDKRVKLEVLGPPGELLIPPPPYWFGAKGRLPSLPLLRERLAKFTLPADMPPGPIRWQAANANGATLAGVFIVGTGNELVEDEKRTGPQVLPTLPVTISGRLAKNEEVDHYRFTATKAGPITCELTARRLGSNFNGVIEVFDDKNRRVAEAVDTEGNDPILTFPAMAGMQYTVAVRDIDHAGDRSFTYRLSITPGPRVITTIPAVGRKGEAREVEFIGVGIATGGSAIESVRKAVTFPATVPSTQYYEYKLETPWGITPYSFPLSDISEAVSTANMQPFPVALPGAVTGVLDEQNGEARYALTGKKGDRWSILAEARRFGSPLDLTLRLLGADGKELARNDDLPGTTDAGLEYTVPVDGAYQIVVGDTAGAAGSRAAVYRLAVLIQPDGFTLHTALQRFSVPIGGKTPIMVKVNRTGNFKGPIAVTVAGLPAGVTVPANLTITPDKPDLLVELTAGQDAVSASVVTITGTAIVEGKPMTRNVTTSIAGNLAARVPEETDQLLVAMTMKPRVKGAPVDKDTGRKAARGSTFPADITIERLEGYTGEIMLRQGSKQSYQVHGITGRDTAVPPGVTKIAFPCFMPEWLETIRTSRMGIVSEVKLADPKGNVRTLVAPIDGFVTMTMEGALLKLSHSEGEIFAKAGETLVVKVHIARSARLTEPVKLELRLPEELAGAAKAEPVQLLPGQLEADVRIVTNADVRLSGDQIFTIRGTAIQAGNLPVVSETAVRVSFPPNIKK
jgi:hypothetical protein